MKIKLSRSDWELVGRKAGWIKKAQTKNPAHHSTIELPKEVWAEAEKISKGLYRMNAKNARWYAFKVKDGKLYSGEFLDESEMGRLAGFDGYIDLF